MNAPLIEICFLPGVLIDITDSYAVIFYFGSTVILTCVIIFVMVYVLGLYYKQNETDKLECAYSVHGEDKVGDNVFE